MRALLISILALAATSAQAAVPLITRPDWLAKPSAAQVERFYPQLGQLFMINGYVVLHCQVNDRGLVTGCRVEDETPKGVGFGAAAINIAPFFQMKPATVEGAPVGGAEVRIPIYFRAPESAAPPPPAPSGPEPSARALAMGRRLVAALGMREQTSIAVREQQQRTRENFARQPTGASPTVTVAFDSFTAAIEANLDAFLETMARRYAQRLPETQLAAIADFLDSPAGKAWIVIQRELSRPNSAEMAAYMNTVRQDTGRRICQAISCPPIPPAAAAGEP